MGRIIIVDIHLQSITAEKFFDQNVKQSASQNASTRGPPTHSYHPYLRIVSITMFYRPYSIFSAIDPLLSRAKIVVPKPRRRTRSYFRHWHGTNFADPKLLIGGQIWDWKWNSGLRLRIWQLAIWRARYLVNRPYFSINGATIIVGDKHLVSQKIHLYAVVI